MSGVPKLDIRSLYNIHTNNLSVKMETFYAILKLCHEKIARHNKMYKQLECLYLPPVTLYGRPMYNYQELVTFIIEQLNENGLKSKWSSKNKAIYISWKPEDVTLTDDYLEEDRGFNYTEEPNLEILKIFSDEDEGKKKKSKGKGIQHVAVVNYGGEINDVIPVNVKRK